MTHALTRCGRWWRFTCCHPGCDTSSPAAYPTETHAARAAQQHHRAHHQPKEEPE